MTLIADDDPLLDGYVPLTGVLAELVTHVRPVGNGGTPSVSLDRMPLPWRTALATFRARYPDVPPPGDDLMPADAWERTFARLSADLSLALPFEARLRLVEGGPEPEDLAAAPLLATWMPAVEPPDGPLLAGWVEGHPLLGTRWITTSLLIGLDPGGAWARTWSRWSRLGRRLTREEVERARGRDLRSTVQEIDDGALARHLATLREQAGALLRPLERRT